VEDKKQVTLVVSSTANGNILPGQVVFTSTTHRCLPPLNEGKLKCINSSWDLRRSTFKTTKDLVHKVLLAYLHKQIQQLDLQANQKLVWLIDCWSVHKNKEFFN
jgi:hypothetical protein